jgi:hypothetical protein
MTRREKSLDDTNDRISRLTESSRKTNWTIIKL